MRSVGFEGIVEVEVGMKVVVGVSIAAVIEDDLSVKATIDVGVIADVEQADITREKMNPISIMGFNAIISLEYL